MARGAYFAAVIEESRNAIAPWQKLPAPRWKGEEWTYYLAHDWGSSAPSVTYIVAKSPGVEHEGHFYPRDNLVLVDGLTTNEPGSLNKGMGYGADFVGQL